MAKKRTGGPRRHVPLRTCIACRQVDSKRELVRVVRTKDQGIHIDLTGKVAGRGAYLCRSRRCWNKALQASLLNSALNTNLTPEDLTVLHNFAESLPDTLETPVDREGQP